MTFEYQNSFVGNTRVPDLVIPVSELLKAKDYKEDEKAFHEMNAFKQCFRIYTSYCGEALTMLSMEFDDLIKQIGKSGKVVFSCIVIDDGFEILTRVVSNEGEREIKCRFTKCVQGRFINE